MSFDFRIVNQILPVMNSITDYFLSVFYSVSLMAVAPLLGEPKVGLLSLPKYGRI